MNTKLNQTSGENSCPQRTYKSRSTKKIYWLVAFGLGSAWIAPPLDEWKLSLDATIGAQKTQHHIEMRINQQKKPSSVKK